MRRRPHMCIGMSLAPTWLANEGWRQPDSGIEGLFSADYALETAKACEAAHLDFVFRPDASFLPLEILERSFGFASLDPTLLMAAIARETENIGLMTTISTTFSDPYSVARQVMTLQWITRGRAGWNVVTGLDGHTNFGLPERPSSEDRHAMAAEFVAVARALWESFPNEALLVDRESGRYADIKRISPINHKGAHLSVAGPLNLPAFDGPRIPLMQAGGSPLGIDLAGQMADMVFAQTSDMASALRMQEALGARASAHGRTPQDVRLLPGLSLYLANTREEAMALFLANHRRIPLALKLEQLKARLGLDLTDYPLDRRLSEADLPKLDGEPGEYIRDIHDMIARTQPTVEALLESPQALRSVHWQIIGTVEDARQQILEWFDNGAVDGFIAVPGGTKHSLDLTLNELVPGLAAAGAFRSGYDSPYFFTNLA